MSKEVDQIISNAINTEVKSRYGEDVFVAQTIVIVLTERPAGPDDKPDTPRFQLLLKTPQPIQSSTATRMLAEAATLFRKQQLDVDTQEERHQL